MIKFLIKSNSVLYFFCGLIFSLTTIFITASFKILNPTYTGWLTQGDGVAEISWEFFRHQPIFQFPLGLNPKYGLEISSTIAFDGQIPLMSLIFHPFSSILPDRFQYVGIFLLISFTLNYYFAAKIFSFLKMTMIQVIVNSAILSLSPIILNRYIDHTHYSLTSAWLILWAIYLCLKNDVNDYQWILVLNISILIHFYYLLFVFGLFFINLIFQVLHKRQKVINFLLQNSIAILSISLNMLIVGFFYGDIDTENIGYGFFKSTIISLFDSSGWSLFLPDLPELDGAYEGFSYIGAASLFLIVIYLFLSKKNTKIDKTRALNFTPVWITSILLYFYSLSNKIAFGKYEILEFYLPTYIQNFTNTFRSSGRYTWLLVLFLFIFITYKLFLSLTAKTYTILIIFSLLLVLIDSSKQLTSEKYDKFIAVETTNLNNPAWYEINKCYKNLRVYPPVAAVDNVYNFTNLAQKLRMGINTGRLGKFSSSSQNYAFAEIHNAFKSGNFDNEAFYVFTTSEFVPIEFINYYKNFALRTINKKTSWGTIDNYTFIAPNLIDCDNAKIIKRLSINYGPLESYVYNGGILEFGTGKNSDKYVLTAAKLVNEGIIPQDESFEITLILDEKLSFNYFSIVGKISKKNNASSKYGVFINQKLVNYCIFNVNENKCDFPINKLNLKNQILNLTLKPENHINQNILQEIVISQLELS